jgi:hypothetical protein
MGTLIKTFPFPYHPKINANGELGRSIGRILEDRNIHTMEELQDYIQKFGWNNLLQRTRVFGKVRLELLKQSLHQFKLQYPLESVKKEILLQLELNKPILPTLIEEYNNIIRNHNE